MNDFLWNGIHLDRISAVSLYVSHEILRGTIACLLTFMPVATVEMNTVKGEQGCPSETQQGVANEDNTKHSRPPLMSLC